MSGLRDREGWPERLPLKLPIWPPPALPGSRPGSASGQPQLLRPEAFAPAEPLSAVF